MGPCASKPPQTKEGSARQTTATGTGQGSEEHPDFGLRETHELIKFLGRGGTGDTWLFREKATGEHVAIKLIKRPIPKVIMPNILREIKIQAELGEGHINVINAKEVILTHSHLALSLEYAACGSLTSYVAEKWQHAQQGGLFLTEDEARYFMRQFIGAVEYCHKHCVAHRDLKLDNTLLDDSNPPMLKLCDFGFAKIWDAEDANMYTHIGTPVYMSPELITSRNGAKGYDGKSVDVWASGVLLIVMLLGTFPFDHTNNPDPNTSEAHVEVWLQQVRSRWSEVPHIRRAVENLSTDCMDLLNKIFVVDEKKRITIEGIKAHPWYNKPLLSKYQKAEEDCRRRQAQIEEDHQTLRINAEALRSRNMQLQGMIEQSAVRPAAGGSSRSTPLLRIDLREEGVMEPAPAGAPGVGMRPSMDITAHAMKFDVPLAHQTVPEEDEGSVAAGQAHSAAPVNGIRA